MEVLKQIHSEEYIDKSLSEIKGILLELYGEEQGMDNYNYLLAAMGSFLESLSNEEITVYASFTPSLPYDHLKGKVFAIAYPDNIYNNSAPTLKTLGAVLSDHFPSVNGIHILPERVMSHGDLWPQDLFPFMPVENAVELVENLQKSGILDKDRYITPKYQEISNSFKESLPENVTEILDRAFNSHFNDGGFSQSTRDKVDPRFGSVDDIKELTKKYSVMLDYVVNHVDIDSEVLEAYKRGENSGNAFIIISPEEYASIKKDGSLYKTFRPRPFPLYTGMRKYPLDNLNMNDFFKDESLSPIDKRIVDFLAIWFKVENDQGLTAGDKRIFTAFRKWLSENGIDENILFTDSSLQATQKILKSEFIGNMGQFLKTVGIDSIYADVFISKDDGVYGEKFFIYTTFSESQADINPLTPEGFKMIIDDLYHLLSSGSLSMMRMDAIKYLWKEKGKKNFDMPEGNKFIDFMRKLMALTSPGVLPLDEINSPDAVVYEMSKGGAFAYIFGPVNATVTAFNERTLKPMENYYNLFKEKVPDNFVPFVMLSTHDGRSVQGIGVHRRDGHVSIEQFYHLKETIENQGGMAKFRSVPVGEISADTFYKVIGEAGLLEFEEELLNLFMNVSGELKGSSAQKESGDVLILKRELLDRKKLTAEISKITGRGEKELFAAPSIDFFLNWIIDGKTIYELCATTRSSLKVQDNKGRKIDPEMEAARLALAEGLVLTTGQAVPAIYFNDLLGIENDFHGFEISGKPRDLNRHKNYLPGMNLSNPADPFNKKYLPLINKILELRIGDGAFYPGSKDFEFTALTDTLFLNHPYHKGDHSLILGNISDKTVSCKLSLETLAGVDKNWMDVKKESSFTDGFTERTLSMDNEGELNLELPPYGMIWLK